jgi:diguanylate cyclase
MIDAIFTMAKSFKYSIVAEGVEHQEQLDYLIEHECDIIQGYFFSKPLNKEDFEAFYDTHKA